MAAEPAALSEPVLQKRLEFTFAGGQSRAIAYHEIEACLCGLRDLRPSRFEA
jgi:hypothetical protein